MQFSAIQGHFQKHHLAVVNGKALINPRTLHYVASTKQQTDKVVDKLVKIILHLAAKNIFPLGCVREQHQAKRRVNI